MSAEASLQVRLDALELQVKKLTNKVAQLEHETEKRLDDIRCQMPSRTPNSFNGLDSGPPLVLPFPEVGIQ